MITEFHIKAAVLAAICFYAGVRLRFELQMMQQNSYRPARYLRWLRGDFVNVDRVTGFLMAVIVGVFLDNRWAVYAIGSVGLLALYKGVRELRIKYKKPPAFTARAIRIYSVGIALMLAAMVSTGLFSGRWALVATMWAAVLSPVVIILSVMILWPVEKLINLRYIRDARRILASMPDLIVVGITGSYGKTSTKHYLHRILSERFSVAMTPGSYNTTLGVVRTVREHLKPYTEVFIVEMGAKQPGDIAEICDLVHPSIGIVTAVGEQHLESFKTVENVQKTKFELIDALPPDGVAILNDDFVHIAGREVTNVANVLRYGSPDITPPPFDTRLAGRHNLSNLYAAWLAGRVLGMADGEMRYAIGTIEPVEHRLNIKHTPGGVTVIDDAFNSNPHGAAMALEVLAGFTGGRRIAVTPGMIELGRKQYEYNKDFGRQMAGSCDLAIVVGEHNREAILAGLAEGGFAEENIYTARDFAGASAKVREIVRAGDTVLYENDLPDTFR